VIRIPTEALIAVAGYGAGFILALFASRNAEVNPDTAASVLFALGIMWAVNGTVFACMGIVLHRMFEAVRADAAALRDLQRELVSKMGGKP
jgi:hypothetical protein